ncbi:hypothetical protein [Desulfogranum japonicum]|uniref:hypothetical protein n=1 Tax=Desulfogranum japonicum TaxID=231447 RepID=UPI0004101A51|nr:hypothetical protein [Desulfogranum japonicum]
MRNFIPSVDIIIIIVGLYLCFKSIQPWGGYIVLVGVVLLVIRIFRNGGFTGGGWSGFGCGGCSGCSGCSSGDGGGCGGCGGD